MLDALARGISIMAKPGADSGNFIGGNGRTNSTAADQDAALGRAPALIALASASAKSG